MTACGGGNNKTSASGIPAASYALSAQALNPASIAAGDSSTSVITLIPNYGYGGTVTLSCSSVTGGATPDPTCSFNPNPVSITASAAVTSTLTVSTSQSAPGSTYAFVVSAMDGSQLSPANGSQNLTLSTISVVAGSYDLTTTALSPVSLAAGGSATAAVTVSPGTGYTGTVTLSCNITGGGTPDPTCSFSPNPVVITAGAPATSTVTVVTSASAPSSTYAIAVNASDANQLAPSNGAQSLNLTTSSVEHIVIIVQENRTPDNLFHDPVLMANGADIASTGLTSGGQSISLTPGPLAVDYDISHTHTAFLTAYDNGAMDGADQVSLTCDNGPCPPNPPYYYVQASDVEPYFQMAEQYTFGDRMFQTNQGPSFPAHQFILSGTSAPTATSNLFVAEDPNNGIGCISPPDSWVLLIDPDGLETTNMYPCLEHQTLVDELDAANLSWRYYAPSGEPIWTAPNAIQHLCGPNVPPPNATVCESSDWLNDVVFPSTGNGAPVLTDIANKQLATVSWVIPAGYNSDHAGSLEDTGGPSWVASIVNAIGNSAYWNNTVIIVMWDDWGGWYDHVPPPEIVTGNGWGAGYLYGFRVPLIVISPFAKNAYISHVNHDFGSILKFTEQTFNLPSLGYADAYADDLSDCFNLSQAPTVFRTIDAPLSADHFIHDPRPPTPPDND